MKKRIIIILILILALISSLLFINDYKKKIEKSGKKTTKVNTKTSDVKKNTNENVIKNVNFNNLDITNIDISYVKEVGSTFSAKVKNNTQETINIESFNIVFKDKDNKEISTVTIYVGGNVTKGQENKVKSTVKEDLTNATSVEYKIN